jgi:hypothetical protein
MPPRLASGRGLVWCPDWFQGTSLGSSPDCFPDWFQEPVWEAVWTASQTASQEAVWEAVWTASQTASQTPIPGGVWEAVQDAPKARFRGFREKCEKYEKVRFPPIPGNRRFGTSHRPRDGSRVLIPYSIYISQFQTGTPKPRYIGFRAGGRENGTRNGQFRPVFGHILRPLPEPSLFVTFHVLEHVFSLFVKSRKSELQTPSRTWFLGWVSGAVWSSFPGAAPDWCLGRVSGGVSGEVSGAASQELLQTAPDLPPDWCHGLESATNQTTPGASPCCQVGKSAQVTPTCHGMP